MNLLKCVVRGAEEDNIDWGGLPEGTAPAHKSNNISVPECKGVETKIKDKGIPVKEEGCSANLSRASAPAPYVDGMMASPWADPM